MTREADSKMRTHLRHLFTRTAMALLLTAPLMASAPAEAAIQVTSIGASLSAPTAGTPVTWSAAASGATTAVLYRFWLYNKNTQTWTMLQDYSTSSSVVWSAASGTHHVQVWVKESASASLLDAWKNSEEVTVEAAAATTLSSVNVSTTATLVLSPVVFTAAAAGGSGAYEYRFFLYDVARGTWTVIQDYSTSATAAWTPSLPGNYFSQVWVRAAGSAAAWQDWRNSASITVSPLPRSHLTSVTVSSLATTVRSQVSFAATAGGGTGQYEYRFFLFDSSRGTWTLLQDYSASPSVSWAPEETGTYWVQVWVRTAGSQNNWEDWRNSNAVTVSPSPWTLTSVTASASIVQTGGPIIWTAHTSGTAASVLYQFWLRNDTAGTWQLLQDYSASNTVTFNSHRAGHYYVQVWAKSTGSGAWWDYWMNSEEVDVNGPTPPDAPPAWTVVRTVAGSHVVTWEPIADVDGYLVLESNDRATLSGSPSTSGAATVTAPPYAPPGTAGNTPRYFRVFAVTEGVVGSGGPIAGSTTVSGNVVPTPYPLAGGGPGGGDLSGEVTPALWDIDGDGCLDLIGRRGNCDGSFTAQALDPLGPGLLVAPGRANRDSRFADFTGDGIVDIFTNVYSRADDDDSQSILLIGQPDGTFREDAGITTFGIGGYGETVVAADFDNDGDVDLYLPHYFNMNDGARSRLLVNNGHGVFQDVGISAGVSSTAPFNPEGAQGLDFNQDGWIDIAVATHLYINNGNLTFTDVGASVGLPAVFDEGLKLFDADLDGDLDLVHNDAAVTRLYRNNSGHFDAGTPIQGAYGFNFGYGLNVCDVNGDGWEDVLIAENDLITDAAEPRLLLNGGGSFAATEIAVVPAGYVDLIACADLDRNGLPDIVARSGVEGGHFQSLVNNASSTETLTIRVLGAGGERNQQGRAVRVRPVSGSNQTILRFVESGSAYMAQNGYDQLIGIPWAGDLEVSVLFSTGWVTTTAQAGGALTFYADGTVATGLN